MSPPYATALSVVIVALGLLASISLGSADSAYVWQAERTNGQTLASALPTAGR